MAIGPVLEIGTPALYSLGKGGKTLRILMSPPATPQTKMTADKKQTVTKPASLVQNFMSPSFVEDASTWFARRHASETRLAHDVILIRVGMKLTPDGARSHRELMEQLKALANP